MPALHDAIEVPPVQYDPPGQREHDTENPVPVPTYPSIQTIPVTETLSIYAVQSVPH